MAKEIITIKDIAARAGVSTGTVDRVLHKRPNVSKTALDKVNKALEELDYRPNMYASALAHNKTYNFYVVLPKHEQEAYWDEIEEGALACTDFRRDFGINLKFVYYERFNNAAFTRMVREFFSAKIDGVVIVPTTLEQTARFTEKLTERQIPYVLLDSYMPDLKPLTFFGQDSFASGYFAAKMLMLIAATDAWAPSSRQTERRASDTIWWITSPRSRSRRWTCRSTRRRRTTTTSWRRSSRSIRWCTTASRSTRRRISWDRSCRRPIEGTSRLWVMIWCRRTWSASITAASRSSSPSTPTSRAMPASMPCSMPS